jgi:hypothetical protein
MSIRPRLSPPSGQAQIPVSPRRASSPGEGVLLDACASCLPTHASSSQFWASIADPETDQPFFVNPATGETRWSLAPGTFVLPRSADGEWWELWDAGRELPYYFHSVKKTSVCSPCQQALACTDGFDSDLAPTLRVCDPSHRSPAAAHLGGFRWRA